MCLCGVFVCVVGGCGVCVGAVVCVWCVCMCRVFDVFLCRVVWRVFLCVVCVYVCGVFVCFVCMWCVSYRQFLKKACTVWS